MRFMLKDKIIYFFLCYYAIAAADESALSFDYTSITDKASPICNYYAFRFPFTVGNRNVTVTNISKSCYCIEAKSEKDKYVSGTNGSIEGILDITGKTGTVTQYLLVETYCNNQKSTTKLVVTITIDEILKIKPHILH